MCTSQNTYSASELPPDVDRKTEIGSPIKFRDNEVIEDTTKSVNIPYNTIFGKCTVLKARENDSLIVRPHRKDPMAYVCRYKLVKEKEIYRLEPLSWQPGEEELRMHADEYSDFDEQNVHTDTDTQSEAILDLDATIEQIHSNLTNDDIEQLPPSPQLVSPLRIRISGNMKYKAIRTQSNKVTSHNKRSSPDATLGNGDVSPSKRNKSNGNCESSEVHESPKNRSYSSPAFDKMEKIRKNLNQSSFMADESMDLDETPGSPYVLYRDDHPLKMTLRKESKGPKTPLKERNENTVNSHELTKTSDTPFNLAQHEIMKSTHCTRSK